ncbi:MAG: ABC transporter permease, partial [Dehalococcoidia bacterium]|nr:ABC transporter permease [Dehalococcoidia bacterium]
MNPLDILITAVTSLSANKMRASLTLLGIVIGVTAVIVLVSLGRGVQASITSEFEGLGANLITVTPGSEEGGGFGAFFGEGGDETTLTLDDAYAIRDSQYAPSVIGVAPEISTFARVVYGREEDWTQVIGVTQEYETVRNYNVVTGDFISHKHVEEVASVAVIGAGISEFLFGYRDPVGQTIKMNGKPFTIVGVLESQEGLFSFLDQRIVIPITTAHYRLSFQRNAEGAIPVDSINVQATSSDSIESAQDEVSAILRLQHRITD